MEKSSEYKETPDERYLLHIPTGYYVEKATGISWKWNSSTQQYIKVSSTTPIQSLKLVVLNSKILQPMTIFKFTMPSLKIGRDHPSAIRLKELEVSRFHCVIYFRRDYYLADVGSTHGTYLNNRVMAEPKEASVPVRLQDGDLITIGSTEFRVHLHEDGDCEECREEPAYVIPKRKKDRISKRDRMENLRLQELERLKQQFGVEESVGVSTNHWELKKKAKMIMKEMAKPIHVPFAPPSAGYSSGSNSGSGINVPLKNNKGESMLTKMGWVKGTGLGTSKQGIKEPVKLSTQTGKDGLGKK